ncbi:MAG: hypothetical protein GY724_01995, partial [Actinomycetia bacterium]|nr:hypothetical protein [Actinomycetes bacterium]
ELIPVFGALDELAPGQTALVAYQLNPERDLRMRTRVTAIPTDGVSSEPAGPTVSAQVSFDLNTFEPDEDPGFGDGFSAAVDILKGIWIGLTVSVGFLILPLLVLVPLVWLGRRGWREYRRRRPPRPRPGAPGRGPIPSGYQPPPPAPNPVPAPAPDSQAGGTSGSPTPQS